MFENSSRDWKFCENVLFAQLRILEVVEHRSGDDSIVGNVGTSGLDFFRMLA